MCIRDRAQAAVSGEPLQQVVVGLAALAHREGDGDGVLLDRLVGNLAADALAHGGHEDLGGGEDRQGAPELAGGDRRGGAEGVKHRP